MLDVAPVRVVRRAGHLAVRSLAAVGRARSRAAEPMRARAEALHALCRAVCDRHGFEVTVRGTPPGGPSILVSNHRSYVDPLAILALIPAAPIAKVEIERWPIVGDVCRAHGVLFVSRGAASSGARVLKGIVGALRGGVSVLNFPEGTTTDGEEPIPFAPAAFALAPRLGVPVVPIAICYESRDAHWTGTTTFVPHYLRTAARRRLGIVVSFGEPIFARKHDGAAELALRAHRRVSALLREVA